MKGIMHGLLALAIAIALTSFHKYESKETNSSFYTYRYIGFIYDDSNYDDPNNWVMDGGTFCDQLGVKLCTINAQPNPWNVFIPDFSGLSWWDHVRTTVNTSIVCNRSYKE